MDDTDINRVFILALDGLEYKLVVKYRLKPIMQEVYGTIDVSCFSNLLTPVIWASFITGREPEEHGITSWWHVPGNKVLNKILHWARYNLPLVKNISSTKARKLLSILGLKPRPPLQEDLKAPTFFDVVKPSVALFVPGYNEEPWIRETYSRNLRKGIWEAEETVWEIHQYRKRKLLETLRSTSNWRLFMAWLDLADLIGHLYMSRSKLKVMKAYFELARLATLVRSLILEDTLLMIVSDHGMNEEGEHSNHAFYSFNKQVNWKPKKITDYYEFIIKTLVGNVEET